MQYVSTFNTVFVILMALQAINLVWAYFYEKELALKIKNKTLNPISMVIKPAIINIGWLVLLVITGFYDLPAVTTFLAVITVVGIPYGFINSWLKDRRNNTLA